MTKGNCNYPAGYPLARLYRRHISTRVELVFVLRQEYFATRLFGLVSARHGRELMAVDRLVQELTDVAQSPIETRLRTLFDVYDENGKIALRSGIG